MSQDYTTNVYDSTFSVQTTMENVEKNFAALKSAFSGSSAPSNPVAGMWWFDTSANILKLRNEANNAWQSVWNFASNKPVITNLSNEITGAMISSAIKDPAAGTAGLRTLGTGAQQAAAGNQPPPDNSITAAKLAANKSVSLSVPSSDTPLQVISATSRSTTSTTYTKLKEIKIPKGGTLRIAFTLISIGTTAADKAYGKIYRNGTPVGTERTVNDAESEFFEDISGWSENDLCQIYVHSGGHSIYVKDFKIYASAYEVTLD